MKSLIILACLITLVDLSQFGGSAIFIVKQDSPGSQQRYQFRLAASGNPVQKRWSTLVIYSVKNRLGNEISLPVGFNQSTVRVSSGDRILQVDEDYVFIPTANRIKVLDEDALTSQYPLTVTYERFTLGSKP